MKDNFSKMRSFMDKHVPIKMTEEELKKEGDALSNKRREEEDRLLKLYEEKKLTNKNTIAKAKSIKARRAAAKSKKAY